MLNSLFASPEGDTGNSLLPQGEDDNKKQAYLYMLLQKLLGGQQNPQSTQLKLPGAEASAYPSLNAGQGGAGTPAINPLQLLYLRSMMNGGNALMAPNS